MTRGSGGSIGTVQKKCFHDPRDTFAPLGECSNVFAANFFCLCFCFVSSFSSSTRRRPLLQPNSNRQGNLCTIKLNKSEAALCFEAIEVPGHGWTARRWDALPRSRRTRGAALPGRLPCWLGAPPPGSLPKVTTGTLLAGPAVAGRSACPPIGVCARLPTGTPAGCPDPYFETLDRPQQKKPRPPASAQVFCGADFSELSARLRNQHYYLRIRTGPFLQPNGRGSHVL